MTFTAAQRKRVKRASVGRLDDGRRAFPARDDDTPEMVAAIFAAFDDELVAGDRLLVDWCPHTSDYQYRHGCDEWCDNPRPRFVWTAAYPTGNPQ